MWDKKGRHWGINANTADSDFLKKLKLLSHTWMICDKSTAQLDAKYNNLSSITPIYLWLTGESKIFLTSSNVLQSKHKPDYLQEQRMYVLVLQMPKVWNLTRNLAEVSVFLLVSQERLSPNSICDENFKPLHVWAICVYFDKFWMILCQTLFRYKGRTWMNHSVTECRIRERHMLERPWSVTSIEKRMDAFCHVEMIKRKQWNPQS